MRKFVAGIVVGVLAIPLLVLLLCIVGAWPMQANSDPPLWEAALARIALGASLSRRAAHVANPVALSADNLREGMHTYKDACGGCHGDPSSSSDYGASFYPRAPQFAKTPPHKPDWQLFWLVKYGVRYSGMSAWDRQWRNDQNVSDDHIWKVVTFLSHLDELPPEVDKEWHTRTQ